MPRSGRAREPHKLASFGRRLAAYLLDVGVPYAVILTIWIALGSSREESTTLGAVYIVGVVSYLVWSWTQGSTLAMAALGMGVEAEAGGAVPVAAAVTRLVVLALMQLLALVVVFALVYLVLDSFPPQRLSLPVVVLISALIVGGAALLYVALRTPPYWHDRLSHTRVLRSWAGTTTRSRAASRR